MIPGLKSPAGVLFATPALPSLTSNMVGGIAVESSGAVCVTGAVSTTFTNGLMVSPIGQLVLAPGGVIAGYNNGLPITVDGAIVSQLDGTPVAADPYGGGVRVGSAGVFITYTPPVGFSAFSAGFDDGFS